MMHAEPPRIRSATAGWDGRTGAGRKIAMMRRTLALTGLLAAAESARAQYRIIDLGTLGGGESQAHRINERGTGRLTTRGPGD